MSSEGKDLPLWGGKLPSKPGLETQGTRVPTQLISPLSLEIRKENVCLWDIIMI